MLTVEEFDLLIKNIQNKTHICLMQQYLSLEQVKALFKILDGNTIITSIDFAGNHLKNEGAIEVAKYLQGNTIITSISISSNCIAEEGAIAIAEALEKNTTLKSLEIGYNHIRNEGAKAVILAVSKHKSITKFGIANNLIEENNDNQICKYFAEMVLNNHYISDISFGENKIGDNGIITIAEALKTNVVLKNIDLRSSSIGDPGAIAIANLLQKNTTISNINLYGNNIGDDGVVAIAEALEKNTAVTNINLQLNKIKTKGAIAFAKTIEINQSITSLDFYHNKIGAEGVKHIARALTKNISIRSLNLGGYIINEENIKSLADALEKNETITYIDINWNKIGNEGAKALARALSKNQTITYIDFIKNDIKEEGYEALLVVLSKHLSITKMRGIEKNDQLNAVFDFNKIRKKREFAEKILVVSDKKFETINIADKTFILNLSRSQYKFSYLKDAKIMADDPAGVIPSRKVYNDQEIEIIHENLKALKAQVVKNEEFISNYYIVWFEQSYDLRGLISVKNQHFKNTNVLILKVVDVLYEISRFTATKVVEQTVTGNVQMPDLLHHNISNKQRQYTKEFAQYNECVSSLKEIGIIKEKQANYELDIAETKLIRLKKYNFNEPIIVKVLKNHDASDKQIAEVISCIFTPTTQLESTEIKIKKQKLQQIT